MYVYIYVHVCMYGCVMYVCVMYVCVMYVCVMSRN